MLIIYLLGSPSLGEILSGTDYTLVIVLTSVPAQFSTFSNKCLPE